MMLLLLLSTLLCLCASAYQATTIPPLIDVPTFSLSTSSGGDDDASSSSSTMNILTYASPVAIKPHRMWSISLYKGTLSHENFIKEKRGILQLLRPAHALCKGDGEGDASGKLIRVLGGSSGRDVDKQAMCEELGFAWKPLECNGETNDIADWPQVLPHCVYYLKLELVGEMIDCGSHDVALCRVVEMVSEDDSINAADELDYISTRTLREMDIISEFGRIKDIE
mmetsp:Transcript_34856/g.71134  ORF Transcript_34856/g.71134 Transcript_34856/m.71134 type:complete len:225 (+) Transcript_34856:3-677(+)